MCRCKKHPAREPRHYGAHLAANAQSAEGSLKYMQRRRELSARQPKMPVKVRRTEPREPLTPEALLKRSTDRHYSAVLFGVR